MCLDAECQTSVVLALVLAVSACPWRAGVSGVGSCTGDSEWGVWSVEVPRDVPSEWISSAQIFTSPSFTQSEPDRRGGFPCICESLKT